MSSQQATSSKRKCDDSDDASKNIRIDSHQTATSSKRKSFNSDEDDASKNIRIDSPNIFLAKPNEYHSSIGLKNTLHGIIYQLKLLMLFVNIALKNGYQFRLATEMDAAEKFDDLVFQFKQKNKIEHRFLQAKHKQDESTKITYNDLVSENDGEFSLQKYFNSFRRIKQNPEFEGNLQDFIICTNINLDFDDDRLKPNNVTKEIEETDKFFPRFNEHGKSPARYKLIVGKQHDLYDILKKTSDIHILAKELFIAIKDKKQLNLKSSIIKTYHQALVKEKIIDDIKIINNEYIGKFSDNFIKYTGLSEPAYKLREILQEYLEKNNDLKLDKNTELKLSSTFGKGFEFDDNPKLNNIPEFTDEIVQLVVSANGKVIKIDGRTYNKDSKRLNALAVADNIHKLAGHVLVIEDTKTQFRKSFFDDTIKLKGNLEKFRDTLKNGLQTNGKTLKYLEEYQWKIGCDFITCEEEQLDAKTFLPNDIIKDEEIEEFFKKLVFAVGQLNEKQLSDIIRREMGEYWNLLDASLFTDSFEIKMLDWFKLKGKEMKEGTWITNKNEHSFFDPIEAQVNTLITVGLSTAYPAELKGYGIDFKNEDVVLKNFLKPDGSKNFFNLVTSTETFLCAIKVFNILKLADVSERYKRQDSCIFMRLKTVILPTIQDIVKKAFHSISSHFLLVIDCDSEVKATEGEAQELYNKLHGILKNSKNQNKKIILITKENDALANKFETESEYKDKYEKSKADHTLLTDLTQSSQVKLLGKPVVLFQGENISFDALIDNSDEESKKIINSDTLVNLIKNEQIKIGNELKGLGEIKDYYISRSIYTQVNFSQAKMEEDITNNLISDYLVISGTYIGLANKNNIFVFDDNNYESASKKFEELCVQNKESNIHWLKCELGRLLLHDSKGSILSLIKYREMNKYDKTYKKTSKAAIRETEFLIENKSKVIIISDTAGMGKSTVLSSLSMEIKKIDSSIWVIRIDLNDYTTIFAEENKKKTDFSSTDINKVVDFLLNYILNSQDQSKLTTNLEIELFRNCIISQGKIALLFDGFDEISPDYQDFVINLLQRLKNTKVDKLVVTTRPNMRELLENKLEVFSDMLKPFSKPNQIEFLTKFWIKNLKLNNLNQERENRLNRYADSLIEKFSTLIDDEVKEFIGIPLQTMMLAEIFQGDSIQRKLGEWESCKKFIASDNINPKFPKKFNLHGLYKLFLKKKFYDFHLRDKKHTDFSKSDSKNLAKENYQRLKKRHSLLALFELLNDEDLKELLFPKEIKKLDIWIKDIENVNKNEGIIDKILDNKPHFIHRTFTEYFACFALVKKMKFKPQIVCSLVNSIIVNASPVFISKIAEYQDYLDKTFLHYAIEYNKKNIVDPVLNYKNDILENDILKHGIFKKGKYKNSKIVKFVNKKDNQDKTALDYAEESKLDMNISFKCLLLGANIDGLTQEYRKNLTHYMLHNKTLVNRKLLDAYAYEYNMFRPIQENLLVTCAEIFPDFSTREQSRLLSYFFVHGRVKVIDTLLSSINEEKERKWLLNSVDLGLTPLDRVNSSDQINDDERLEITKYLVENGGTKINNIVGLSNRSSTSYITKILHAAVQNGHFKTFDHFIDKENCNYYCLHFSLAVKNQQFNIVKYLMENYKNYIKDKGNTPLHYAIKYDANLKIIKYCIGNGNDINAQNDKGETPLFHAIYKRRLSAVKYLIDHGADFDIADRQNYTALNRAIEQDERDIINYLLLECKAKINFTSELIRNKIEFFENPSVYNLKLAEQSGMPRLHSAIKLKQLEWAKFIIQQGAEINIIEREGKTPLHWAAELQQTEIVEMLLQYGAIFDAKDISNSTAFGLVSQSGSNKIYWLLNVLEKLFSSQNLMQDLEEQLLKQEFNEQLKDWGPYGFGYPDVCSNHHHHHMWRYDPEGSWPTQLCLNDTMSCSNNNPILFVLNAKNEEGKTLLHIAAETNDLQALNILLKFNQKYIGRRERPQCETDRRYKYYQSISINAMDSLGNTPLHLAAQKNKEMVSLFLEKGAIYNAENLQRKTPKDLAKNDDHINTLMQATENLFISIEKSSLVNLKNCINRKIYINAKDKYGRTPLHIAASSKPSSKQSDVVEILLEDGADSIALDNYNRTPLHLAAENGNIKIVKLLLKHGAIFNAKDKCDKAPYEYKMDQSLNLLNEINELFKCVQSNNPKLIIDYIEVIQENFEVDFGTILNIRDNQFNTILHYAAKSNDIKIAEFLLKNDAASYAQNKIEDMAKSFANFPDNLDVLESIEKMFKIIDYIQENKIFNVPLAINVRNNQNRTLLHMAAEHNKLYLTQRLARASADVNCLDINEKTPLYCVVEKGMLDSAKLLIDHGANINLGDKDRKTPLYCFVEKGMLDSAKFLIEHGANINLRDKDGKTPLYCVVEKGMLDSAKFLIDYGANVNLRDRDGKTPLYCVVEKGMLDSAKFLIDHGAYVNFPDKDEKTPLHCVVEKGMLDSAKFLIDHGAYVNFPDKDEKTPLHRVAEKGMLDSAKFLIKHGADVNCIDIDDKTPLDYCLENNISDLVKFLIENGAVYPVEIAGSFDSKLLSN